MKLRPHDPICGQHFYWWECDCNEQERPMKASLANAIIKAYEDIKHNIPEETPDSTACPLLVQFTLGDVRSFVRGVTTMRESVKNATGG